MVRPCLKCKLKKVGDSLRFSTLRKEQCFLGRGRMEEAGASPASDR